MRIRLETVGCRLNTGEVQALELALAADGHRVVGGGEAADLCVVNTCAVTAAASHSSRQALRRVCRAHPDALVVATGCLAELDPTSVSEAGAHHVVGSRDKDDLPALLTRNGLLRPSTDPVAAAQPGPIAGHTRVFVKVQDGCDNRCAYCVVRVARGPGRSRDPLGVVAELHALERRGVREVVLTGVHLGSYGHDRGRRDGLAELVGTVLDETSLPRIRLSSLEPWDVTERLLERFANPRLLPHLHLPLQSGCDATLARMARRTSQREFARLVGTARRLIPSVSISTDLMVAFPGETEEEFAASLAFVESMAFARVHVFPFSPRRGTPAAAMAGRLPVTVARARAASAREVARRHQDDFHRRFLGTTQEILWESFEPTPAGRRWSGLTPNYIRTLWETDAPVDLANRVTPTLLVALLPGAMSGRPMTR